MKKIEEKEIDILFNTVRSYRDSSNFKEILDFIANMPQYAPFNAMMINMQKAGSTYVASANKWKEFNRIIKPGARPLVILKRFGPISYVYEMNDTEVMEGKPDLVPEKIQRPFYLQDVVSDYRFEEFKRVMLETEGVEFYAQNYGSDSAGHIRLRTDNKTYTISKARTEKVIYVTASIVVNSSLNITEQLATIFHELGHYFCGHLGPVVSHIPDNRINLPSAVMEFEAETVCWLLCKRIGIDNWSSAEYLTQYLSNNREIPEGISIDAIMNAAGKIESILAGTRSLCQDILTKKNSSVVTDDINWSKYDKFDSDLFGKVLITGYNYYINKKVNYLEWRQSLINDFQKDIIPMLSSIWIIVCGLPRLKDPIRYDENKKIALDIMPAIFELIASYKEQGLSDRETLESTIKDLEKYFTLDELIKYAANISLLLRAVNEFLKQLKIKIV